MSSRRPGHRRRGRQSKGGSWFRSIDAWQWGLACSGWLTMLGMVGLPPGLPLRTVLVFGFVLLCPGLAIAGLIVLVGFGLMAVLAPLVADRSALDAVGGAIEREIAGPPAQAPQHAPPEAASSAPSASATPATATCT